MLRYLLSIFFTQISTPGHQFTVRVSRLKYAAEVHRTLHDWRGLQVCKRTSKTPSDSLQCTLSNRQQYRRVDLEIIIIIIIIIIKTSLISMFMTITHHWQKVRLSRHQNVPMLAKKAR